MEENKKTKIIFGVIGVLLLGALGFTIYTIIKRRKLKPLVSPQPPIPIEQTKKADTTNIQTVAPQGKTTTAMPFKNKTEGNLFRAWVNDYFPTYAKQIDLDRSGSHNNSFIKKAWTMLGGMYKYAQVGIQGLGAITKYMPDYIVGTGNTGVPSGSFNAKTSAEALYNAMRGWGTNETQFFQTMEQITPSQRLEVEQYFDTNNIGKGETLEVWIRGDFSGNNLKKALSYIKN